MFNDDVLAICPNCGSNDVGFDADSIFCHHCDLVETFAPPQDLRHSDITKGVAKTNMIAVLQRWQFAG